MRGGAVRPRHMTPTWHAEHTPDVPAIAMGASGETVNYAQLEERFARALRSRGLAAGDHIAIFMENNRPYLEVAWAAQRSGLYYTAVNTHLRPGEVQYVLDDCGAVAVIASQALAEVVAGLDLSRLRVRISAFGDLDGFERYDDVLAGAGADPPPPSPSPFLECEGPGVLYSSGTTRRPPGVRQPHPRPP